ncbi:oxidoreductase [Rheinheimera texasensis]|uniref:oxidoreductase n=1 Tax=Rheinheimera texasensis TaxID=306205 RepID=UPI0004E12C33|nr:oxidoreductase [Rheinheimera texasensis]
MLEGKTILVAGAGGLLGCALSVELQRRGAHLVLADLRLPELTNRLSAVGVDLSNVELHQTDFNQTDAVRELFALYPKLAGAVNCTYPRTSSYGRHFFDVTLESFNENVQVHLGAAFLFSQQAAYHFQQQRQPFSLVNLASVYGVVAPRFEIYDDTSMTMPVEYAAIKAAVLQLTKYVTCYVNDSDFRANAVSPGGILDQQPEAFLEKYQQQTCGKGMLKPADICGAIAFLLSDDSKYMQGQNLIVDDGFTL